MYDLTEMRNAVAGYRVVGNIKSDRARINDYLDNHPDVRAELFDVYTAPTKAEAKKAGNPDVWTHKTGYDRQRAAEMTIQVYDAKNGKELQSLDIQPSDLCNCLKDRMNYYLEKAETGLKIQWGRVIEQQLTHQPDEKAES